MVKDEAVAAARGWLRQGRAWSVAPFAGEGGGRRKRRRSRSKKRSEAAKKLRRIRAACGGWMEAIRCVRLLGVERE